MFYGYEKFPQRIQETPMRQSMFIFFVIVIVGLAAICGIGLRNNHNSALKPEIKKAKMYAPPANMKEREQIAKDWLDAAQDVATTLEAKEAVNWVQEHQAPAYPVDNGGAMLVDDPKKDTIGVVVLMDEDKILCDYWRQMIEQKGVGLRYISGDRMMQFRPTKCTAKMKGLFALHECVHALDDAMHPEVAKNATKETSADIQVAGELHAYMVQKENTTKVFGVQYQKLLDRKVEELYGMYQRDGKKVGGSAYMSVQPTPALDDVCGKPASDMERGLRDSHFWLFINMSLIDRHMDDTEDEKRTAKLSYIENEYRQAGIIE
ncbi:MAG: hypothetical protein WCG48_02425 [Candidatus Berkelbacteria bacterium]